MLGKSDVKVQISAVITRADGTVEDLGVLQATDESKSVTSWIKKFMCKFFKRR